MYLSISLIEDGWVVMTDVTTGSANLCIPVRPNSRTLAFITVEQYETTDDAKLAAAGFIANGITAADYIDSLDDEEEGDVEKAPQIAAVPATAG